MSKSKRNIVNGVSDHPTLFDGPMSEGSLDVILGLKQHMSRLAGAAAAQGKDRYQIAAEISRATGRDLTKDSLDKYISSDPAYEPGAVRLLGFCQAVRSVEPFAYLLGHINHEVVTPDDIKFLKLARLEEQRRKIEAEIQVVRAQCGIK